MMHVSQADIVADAVTEETFNDYHLSVGNMANNTFSGSDKIDKAFGRAGDDDLSGQSNDDDLVGGDGTDQLFGGTGMDHLDGGPSDDSVFGDDGPDALIGAEGDDLLDEGPGHGDLIGGAGMDTLVGGLGPDAFVVDPNSGQDVVEDFQPGPGIFDTVALMNISAENLNFEDTPDGVLISWNSGQSSILLEDVQKTDLAQDDFMFLDQKELIPVGGPSTSSDSLPPAAPQAPPSMDSTAASTNSALAFDDFLVNIGTDEPDTFEGTAARDFFFGLGGSDNLTGDLNDDDITGDAANDHLSGGPGMDHLTGGGGDDRLTGGDLADILVGGDGSDSMSGGAGHDTFVGGTGDDWFDGGDGADAFTATPTSGNDVVTGGFTPGPGSHDHIDFEGIFPDQVSVTDTDEGVLVSWETGSMLLRGLEKSQMAQDDFMFNNVEGGAFVPDEAITSEGSALIFPSTTDALSDSQNQNLLA